MSASNPTTYSTSNPLDSDYPLLLLRTAVVAAAAVASDAIDAHYGDVEDVDDDAAE